MRSRTSDTTAGGELASWRMAMYALPALPTAFLYVPLPLLIPAFYAQHLGLSLTAVGTFLFASRLFDMIIDPFLGQISDRTHSRWGKRRPWMVIGTPIVMLGTALVFFPPAGVGGWYLMLSTGIVYFGASMVGLSYSAWGAEIVESYHGRARLAGFREVAALVGTLMAGIIPAVTALWGHGVDRFTIAILGGISIALMPPALYMALRFVPDAPRRPQTRAVLPWHRAVAEVLKNKPFRFITLAFILFSIGGSIANATLVFFITHYLGQPEIVGPVLTISFVAVLAFVPVWIRISRRIGKHRAVGVSLIAAILLSGCATSLLRPGDGWYFVALCAVLGAAVSASLTLPVSIMGDVIDYDTLKVGDQRGGLYFGVWAFATQFAPAAGIGMTLPLLEWLGFRATGTNSPEALDALRLVYCFGPVPFYLIGAVLVLWFPLTAKRHAIIRRRLDRRRERMLAASSSEPQHAASGV